MLGCDRLAAAWASRRNRSTNVRSMESSGKSTLSATGLSSWRSMARYTCAMPPRAMRWVTWYRPRIDSGVLDGLHGVLSLRWVHLTTGVGGVVHGKPAAVVVVVPPANGFGATVCLPKGDVVVVVVVTGVMVVVVMLVT